MDKIAIISDIHGNITALIEVLKENTITPTLEVNDYFNNKNIALLTGRVSAYDLLKRPEIDFEDIKVLFKDIDISLDETSLEQILISIKYEGYIKRQKKQVESFKKIESKNNSGEKILNYKNPLECGKYVELDNWKDDGILFNIFAF